MNGYLDAGFVEWHNVEYRAVPDRIIIEKMLYIIAHAMSYGDSMVFCETIMRISAWAILIRITGMSMNSRRAKRSEKAPDGWVMLKDGMRPFSSKIFWNW